MNCTEGKTVEAVSSAEQFQVRFSAMTEQRNASTRKGKEIGLEAQSMFRLDIEARSMRSHVAELEEPSKTKASNMCAKLRTTDTDVVTELALTECAEYTASNAELEGNLHEVKCKLDFSERCNSLADSWYSMLRDDSDPQNREIASGRVCSGELAQRLANAFKHIDASIGDLIHYAAYV